MRESSLGLTSLRVLCGASTYSPKFILYHRKALCTRLTVSAQMNRHTDGQLFLHHTVLTGPTSEMKASNYGRVAALGGGRER